MRCKTNDSSHAPFWTARSMSPGTKVFCGEPLMKATPSSTAAAAYKLDGAISASPRSIAAKKFSAVSFSPSLTCADVCAVYTEVRICLRVSFSLSLTCAEVCPLSPPLADAPGQAHLAPVCSRLA